VTNQNLLITFGCSWTYGVGVNYSPGMTRPDFVKNTKNKLLCDSLSFRGILSSKLGLDNINFSQGGSSNQRQFRLAKQFFISDEFFKLKKKYKTIIVLWGITSTARNEMFDLETGEMVNFFLTSKNPPIASQLAKYSYDHKNEVQQLALDMKFWNSYFKQLGVENFWFDTFNHHDYDYNNISETEIHQLKGDYNAPLAGPGWPTWEKFFNGNMTDVPLHIVKEIYRVENFRNFLRQQHPRHKKISRLIGNSSNRDIASQIAIKHRWSPKEDSYHYSTWRIDSKKIQYLTDLGLLNPWSHHPTSECHQEISQIFEPYIVYVLNKE
jgi:hypothetical protein